MQYHHVKYCVSHYICYHYSSFVQIKIYYHPLIIPSAMNFLYCMVHVRKRTHYVLK